MQSIQLVVKAKVFHLIQYSDQWEVAICTQDINFQMIRMQQK